MGPDENAKPRAEDDLTDIELYHYRKFVSHGAEVQGKSNLLLYQQWNHTELRGKMAMGSDSILIEFAIVFWTHCYYEATEHQIRQTDGCHLNVNVCWYDIEDNWNTDFCNVYHDGGTSPKVISTSKFTSRQICRQARAGFGDKIR